MARAPSESLEHSRVVQLAPYIEAFRSSRSSKPSGANTATTSSNVACTNAATMSFQRHAAQSTLSVAHCRQNEDHPQCLQGWRSSVHVIPDVSCHLSGHEPAFHEFPLPVVDELASYCLGATLHSRSWITNSASCPHSVVSSAARPSSTKHW